jgi:hypothetical protein
MGFNSGLKGLSNGTMNQVWKGVCEHLSGRTELQGASTI